MGSEWSRQPCQLHKCHMFLLTLNSLMRVGFGFSSVIFRSRVFSHPSADTDEQSTGSSIFTKHSECCDKFFVLTMSLYAFISLLYKQFLQYTLLKSFTVPSAVLTKFARKFHTKHLTSAFIFTKLSTKILLLLRRCVSFEYQGLLQNTRRRSYCFLSMFKINFKRHYRIQQHIAGVQRDVNTSQKRRRRDADIRSAAAAAARRSVMIGGGGVSKMSAAAAAHSCKHHTVPPLAIGKMRTADLRNILWVSMWMPTEPQPEPQP